MTQGGVEGLLIESGNIDLVGVNYGFIGGCCLCCNDNVYFTGNIKFIKPFMIRGKVNGKIDATSDLVIDSCSEVNADINAVRVLIKGKVHGNVTARDLVFVSATGILDGDITSKRVVLEPGSTFSGRCTMVK